MIGSLLAAFVAVALIAGVLLLKTRAARKKIAAPPADQVEHVVLLTPEAVSEPVDEPSPEPPEGTVPPVAGEEALDPLVDQVPSLEGMPTVAESTPIAEPEGIDEIEPACFKPEVPAQPEIEQEEKAVSHLTTGLAASQTVLPGVRLTLEAYSTRLNSLEERQRDLLSRAIQGRDVTLRDRLQRELVIMNDKLALLADSYEEDLACYQEVLAALGQLGDGIEQAELKMAAEELQAGEPQAAEDLLARLSKQPHPAAARAAYHSGQLAECRVDLQKALARYRRAVELEPENPAYLRTAGRAARSLYKYKEALPWLESFVRIIGGAQVHVEPADQALAQRELAYTYVLSGQYQKAGPLYREAMTVLARELGADHPEIAASWYQIGELQETLGEYDKAVSLYKKSLAILEQKRGEEHPILANILSKLAALCMELEMEKEAVPLYERLVRIREKALRPTHPQLAISLNNLAESYRLQGRYAEAEACYQKSLVINEALHGCEHPSVAAILQELAKLCTSQRKPEAARQYQERATALFQKSVEASEKKTGEEALTLEL